MLLITVVYLEKWKIYFPTWKVLSFRQRREGGKEAVTEVTCYGYSQVVPAANELPLDVVYTKAGHISIVANSHILI